MNRKFQMFIPVMLSLLIAYMVQDRATAIFGALACATAGLTAGCMYFGGLTAIARKPFHMLFSALLLYVVALAIGMLLPGPAVALLSTPAPTLAPVVGPAPRPDPPADGQDADDDPATEVDPATADAIRRAIASIPGPDGPLARRGPTAAAASSTAPPSTTPPSFVPPPLAADRRCFDSSVSANNVRIAS